MKRDPYPVAGAAGRRALELAASGKLGLSNGALRVLAFVVGQTALWSKLEDQLSVKLIAKKTNLSTKQVGRNLQRLAEFGVITYRPGTGHRRSTIGLPVVERSPLAAEGGHPRSPPSIRPNVPSGGTTNMSKGVDVQGVPRPRSSPEEDNEKLSDVLESTPWAQAAGGLQRWREALAGTERSLAGTGEESRDFTRPGVTNS